MRSHSWFRPTLLAGALASLTACSVISDLFPDKQKQYRYSSELPDLEVPPDLLGSKIDEIGTEPSQSTAGDGGTGEPSAKPTKKKRKSDKPPPSSTLAETAENAALIELSEPYAEAWNDVSRALGRLKVEITDQNRADGVFYVYYGGEPPKKPEEEGFWDSVASVFNVERDKAREYRVKLENKEDYTFVRVYDQSDNVVSEGKGLELLKRLHKKLVTLHLPEPEGEVGKKAAEAEKKATESPEPEK